MLVGPGVEVIRLRARGPDAAAERADTSWPPHPRWFELVTGAVSAAPSRGGARRAVGCELRPVVERTIAPRRGTPGATHGGLRMNRDAGAVQRASGGGQRRDGVQALLPPRGEVPHVLSREPGDLDRLGKRVNRYPSHVRPWRLFVFLGRVGGLAVAPVAEEVIVVVLLRGLRRIRSRREEVDLARFEGRSIAGPALHLAGIDGESKPLPKLDIVSRPQPVRFPKRLFETPISQHDPGVRVGFLDMVYVDQMFLCLLILRRGT